MGNWRQAEAPVLYFQGQTWTVTTSGTNGKILHIHSKRSNKNHPRDYSAPVLWSFIISSSVHGRTWKYFPLILDIFTIFRHLQYFLAPFITILSIRFTNLSVTFFSKVEKMLSNLNYSTYVYDQFLAMQYLHSTGELTKTRLLVRNFILHWEQKHHNLAQTSNSCPPLPLKFVII